MISVIGLGNIGSIIAQELANYYEVVALDSDRSRVERIVGIRGLVGQLDDVAGIIRESDLVVVALPGQVAFPYVKRILEWGINVVDISYSPENPYNLESIARSSGAIYVPDCGFAPGLSNMLAYRLFKKSAADDIEIIVGGLPERPVEPFLHSVTWSVEGLIDEYTRKASIISDYKLKCVNPLDEIGSVNLPGYGDFEYFTSDGLRTLLTTMKVRNLSEKTIRFRGHLDRMRFLDEMGYFSGEMIDGVSPRKISERIFGKYRSANKDICILLVRTGDGSKHSMLTANGNGKETAMSTLTGIPAVAVSRLLLDGRIDGSGVIPPELIAEDDHNFSTILEHLTKSGATFVSNL